MIISDSGGFACGSNAHLLSNGMVGSPYTFHVHKVDGETYAGQFLEMIIGELLTLSTVTNSWDDKRE